MKYTPKGTAVCDLGIAVNDSYKAQDGTIKETVTFIDVEVWGRTAENCKQYLTKGRPVFVEGQLRLDQWEQDGQKRSKMKVRADRVQFLGGGPARAGGGEQRSSSAAPTETGPDVRPASFRGFRGPAPATGRRRYSVLTRDTFWHQIWA